VVAFSGIVGTAITMACGNGLIGTLNQAEASVVVSGVVQLVGGRFLWVSSRQKRREGGRREEEGRGGRRREPAVIHKATYYPPSSSSSSYHLLSLLPPYLSPLILSIYLIFLYYSDRWW